VSRPLDLGDSPVGLNKKKVSKLGFPEEQRSTNSLASLLDATGMEAGDIVEVINALSKIKRKNRQQDSGRE
jgi:hypothetical protein